MMARSSGLGVLMISVKKTLVYIWSSIFNCTLSYLLHPAFWECPGVFPRCQTPGLGCPEDRPI